MFEGYAAEHMELAIIALAAKIGISSRNEFDSNIPISKALLIDFLNGQTPTVREIFSRAIEEAMKLKSVAKRQGKVYLASINLPTEDGVGIEYGFANYEKSKLSDHELALSLLLRELRDKKLLEPVEMLS